MSLLKSIFKFYEPNLSYQLRKTKQNKLASLKIILKLCLYLDRIDYKINKKYNFHSLQINHTTKMHLISIHITRNS